MCDQRVVAQFAPSGRREAYVGREVFLSYAARAVTVFHEGRGGYVEVDDRRYVIEHVEAGRFAIHFPSGHPARVRAADLEALEALAQREPGKWTIERHDRARGKTRGRR